MSNREFFNPATLAKPPGYSQLVEVRGGRTVYVAGQVALDAENKLVGRGDLAAQTEQVFKNLDAALSLLGGGLSDIVKLTTYMLDISGVPTFRQVRDRFLQADAPPVSTLVQVSQLFRPEFLIEVEAVAWLP